MTTKIRSRDSIATLRRILPVRTVVAVSDPGDWRGAQAAVVIGHSVRFGPEVRVVFLGAEWDGRRESVGRYPYNEGIDYGTEAVFYTYGPEDFSKGQDRAEVGS